MTTPAATAAVETPERHTIPGRVLWLVTSFTNDGHVNVEVYSTLDDAAARFAEILRELLLTSTYDESWVECDGIDDSDHWYIYDEMQDWWLRLEPARLQVPNLAERDKAITILDYDRRSDDNLSIPACAEVWEGYDGVWVEAALRVESDALGWWRCEECERKFYGQRPDFDVADIMYGWLCPECEGRLVLEAWEANDV